MATYQSSNQHLCILVGSIAASGTCSFAVTDRSVSNTYVGKSNWEADAFSSVSIAGLYAVDQLLSEAEIFKITSKMYQGGDTLQACETCPADTLSLQGSTSETDCECLAGSYKSMNMADSKALTLVPGRAEISTLANRGYFLGTTTAVFDPTAGPPGANGAVTFDRVSEQHIDGGAHTFDIATHGFTAVLVVMFTGTPVSNERVFDFGNGRRDNNIYIIRAGTGTQLKFAIWNGASGCYLSSIEGTLVQDTWLTVVATYNPNDTTMRLRVGNNIAT